MELTEKNQIIRDKKSGAVKVLTRLAVIYIIFVALRFIIGLFTCANPFVSPDENLYANLARSIHNEGFIALRGQPLSFETLLYSILISPFYGLSESVNLFRVLQFFNTAVMTLAVFPAFFLAQRFLNNKKSVYAVAVLAVCLPDMIMASRLMTECVTYPLLLLTLYLMSKAFEDGAVKTGTAVLTGLCAALLYMAKSGTIVVGIFFALMLLWQAIKENSRSKLKSAGIYIGAFLLTFGLIKLLTLAVLKSDTSVESIYDTYISQDFWRHLGRTLPGMLLYLFYAVIAFGIFPALLPVFNAGLYTKAQKRMIFLCSASVLAMAAGACWMFFASETIGNFYAGRIHIRYIFYFIPLFYMFALSPRLKEAKLNTGIILLSGFLAAMFATVSFNSLLSNNQYCVDALGLSYIIFSGGDFNSRLFAQIIVITFFVTMLYRIHKHGFHKNERAALAMFAAVTILVSNAAGYVMNSHNNDKRLSNDVSQIVLSSAGKTSALVPMYGQYFNNNLSVLDCSLRESQYCVLLEDLCESMGDYGAPTAVTPPRYWVENPVNEIPVCGQYLFNADILNRAVLAQGAQSLVSDNIYFASLTPSQNGRLFHSVLVNTDANGAAGSGCALWIYDEALLSQETVKVYIKLSVREPAKIALWTEHEANTITVGTDDVWVWQVFSTNGAKALKINIGFSACSASAPYILTYMVE